MNDIRNHTSDVQRRTRPAIRGRKRKNKNVIIFSMQPYVDGRFLPAQLQPMLNVPAPPTTTPPNPTVMENDVPKKVAVASYARPSRPVVRKLTF